jgi:selenocysteine-specific elongation factor
VSNGRIVEISLSDGSVYIHKKYVEEIKVKATNLLQEFHKTSPLKAGISKEEFKNKIFGKGIKQKLYDKLIEILSEDTIDAGANFISVKGFEVKFDKRQEEIKNKIYKTYVDTQYQPSKPEEILKGFGREEKAAKMVFDALVDMDKLVKINEEIYLTYDNYTNAKDKVVNFIKNNDSILAAQFRDEIGASRKYAVAILEHFDGIKLTKRIEDKRVLV